MGNLTNSNLFIVPLPLLVSYNRGGLVGAIIGFGVIFFGAYILTFITGVIVNRLSPGWWSAPNPWSRKLIASILLSPVVVGYEDFISLVSGAAGLSILELTAAILGAFLFLYLCGFFVGVSLNHYFPNWWKKSTSDTELTTDPWF